ncbi:glycine N-acyltransferase-like [Mizuhopecten yessoensis]|uniref:glycine N-acyltransferase-like n=1 Tax=Mizuhopecten yessoensis TaxID=6573 RepID=UPI000B4582E1|nr:glycine N-acyltransferase-like [Mizuhopecten yessoensis]
MASMQTDIVLPENMAVHLLPKDLPGVLERLKEKLPDSIAVYTAIKLIVRGLSGYEVYVDSFPDFRAVLVKPDEAAMKDPEHEKNTYMFSSDSSCLQDLIDNSGLLKQRQVFLAVLWKDVFEKANAIICKTAEPSFVRMISAGADMYYCRSVATLP